MSRKSKNKGGMLALKIILLILLGVFSVTAGIYCAKLYTTPYSSEIVESFDEGTLEDVEMSKEKYNILIMGTDKSGMLTDVMMVAQIDPVKNTATVMSIPRDTYMEYDGKKERINAEKVTVEINEEPVRRTTINTNSSPNTKKNNDNSWCWGCCICMIFLFIIFAIFGH